MKCLQQASSEGSELAHQARANFSQAMAKMLEPAERQPPPKVDMIEISHRWKKNRNEVVGSVVISFDKNGIARVPDEGNNRLAVAAYVRQSKGLADYVTAEQPPKPEAPQPDVKEKLKKVEKKAEPKKEALPDQPTEVKSEDTAEKEDKPAKKPVGKKPVGKKK